MSNILHIERLHKVFVDGKLTTPVLNGVDLKVKKGEALAILGSSGSGKTTLLQIMGGLQSFDRGEVFFEETAYSKLRDQALTALRERSFGFVYQFHHLLPELSALENVMLPLMIRHLPKKEAETRAKTLLMAVGLEYRLVHKPSELSGGERQRVALARAMVKQPQILFADEPTGNLDHHSAEKVVELLFAMSREAGTTLIYITHDGQLAQKADRILSMQEGVLYSV